MIILKNTFKRLFRNKVSLLLTMVIPPAMIGFIFAMGSWGGDTLSVGLVDHDQTPLTQQLEEVLAEQAAVRHLPENQIREELAGGKVNIVFVVEPGFTEDILKNRDPVIHSYSIQESNLSLPVRLVAESFIRASRNVASVSEGSRETFYQGMAYYQQEGIKLERVLATGTDPGQNDAAVVSMGILGMNMLFLALYSTLHILKDRENRTFYRVMVSPVTQQSYMIQTILSFLIVLLIQMTGVFLVAGILLNLYLGENVVALYGIMAIFAVVCVAFGIAIAALVKTSRQAGTTASLLITPMAMLGGLLWPREIMPEVLQHAGLFLPTTWMMNAVHKVIASGNFLDAAWEIAILFLFALVFFLLGSWRRVDIAA